MPGSAFGLNLPRTEPVDCDLCDMLVLVLVLPLSKFEPVCPHPQTAILDINNVAKNRRFISYLPFFKSEPLTKDSVLEELPPDAFPVPLP